ncbi:hypothetical protein MAM1_0332c09766 [Mucor ambiguus]|uniref:Zinc finger PHD-type domain-containing protein n=1 Tax=Mucor ambiguus TaxID=91626 RepID=A0A0C9N6N2_9FUNG|nr:hypothetical protein MAM1_0332c09766 [Mucor ambiguus]
MVQCDKCEVWQHCECIGLVQARLPDQYFCDQCQPENHQIVKTSSGRSKRLYNAGLVSTSTANNTSPSLASSDKEDASTSTTSTTKRPSKRRKRAAAAAADRTGCHSPPKTPLMEAKKEQASPVMNTIEESPVIEERSTRSRRTKIPADAIEQGTITTATSLSATASLIPELVKKASTSSSPPSSSTSVSPSPVTTATTTTEKKSSKTKSNSNRHSSSSATPQQQIVDDFGSPSTQHHHHNTASSTPYWNFTDGRPTRESSPPAKIKYPNSKMSFSDMNKRAKQIMECITKMQTEELKRLPPPTLNSKHPDKHTLSLFQEVDSSTQTTVPFNRPRSLSTSSTSSSLSSASTVPLLDDYATTTTSASSSPSTPIPYKHFPHQSTPVVQQYSPEQETSIEILERVSRELAKFQRKFGIVYQNQPHHSPLHHHHQPAPHVGVNGHAKSSTTSK